jgi:hypothetical protein
LSIPAEAPSPALATLLDALIVLEDLDANGPNPLGWSPLPIDRAEQTGTLDQWLALPGDGPQRVVLPGLHTIAERGGKAARRRGAPPPGSELFYASCSLMSAGAETVLLSRWRVGGQSTLDVIREFIQELPHAPAADAWQRSVRLALETPVDPARELRVKPGKVDVELMAKHPFFWAGYMVLDTGWRPAEEPPDAAPPVPAANNSGAAAEVEPKEDGEPPPPAEAAPQDATDVPPPRPTPPGSASRRTGSAAAPAERNSDEPAS